ncbi:MAG TPA: glycosyltransferase family 39 protein [Flavipsychrobacter sp.]|nr:glycosyltransferase family 39 protein [Flavipsychrobacter sp.]
MNVHNFVRYSVIVLLSALLFLPFLGHVHLFDWDEINFAECAREMIVTNDYLRPQIDFQPFWEKPPLFIWMQVVSMKLFGVNEYAARFPNAFMGIITLVTLFYIGKKVANERMAMWWTLLYAATWLPHFYFKSGIIDPTFNYFIFLAFFQVHLLRYASDKFKHAAYAGLFLGLAVLTKGPVAALIAILALVVYIFINKGLWGFKPFHFLVIFVASILPFAAWFASAILFYGWDFGSWFINEFVTYQIRLFRTEDADHGGPFFYHFIVLLLGCFPASVFLFQYSRKRTTDNETARDFTRWMWILFWVTLLLFSIVKTKIVHYSSLCYFPLTYLAALKVEQIASGEIRFKTWLKGLLIFIGCVWGTILIALPFVGLYKHKIIPLIDDPFAVGNLQADVSWTAWESLWGLFYIVAIIVAVLVMRRNFAKGMLTLAVVQIIIIQITILHFTPKIEAYSQRAAIRYFKSFVGKDVYVQPLDYKSFAHLFYTKKLPSTNPNYHNQAWLLRGAVDRPTYFICKVTGADEFRKLPQLQEIGQQYGFVFFRRR